VRTETVNFLSTFEESPYALDAGGAWNFLITLLKYFQNLTDEGHQLFGVGFLSRSRTKCAPVFFLIFHKTSLPLVNFLHARCNFRAKT
jgi:hypothetical protein